MFEVGLDWFGLDWMVSGSGELSWLWPKLAERSAINSSQSLLYSHDSSFLCCVCRSSRIVSFFWSLRTDQFDSIRFISMSDPLRPGPSIPHTSRSPYKYTIRSKASHHIKVEPLVMGRRQILLSCGSPLGALQSRSSVASPSQLEWKVRSNVFNHRALSHFDN